MLLGVISSTTRNESLLTAITARNPAFYSPLNGTGTAVDESGNGLVISEQGTPSAKGTNGWTLPNGVYLQVAHNAVFETDDGATRFGWVDSEVTVVFEVVFSSLASKVSVASKHNGQKFSNGWWLDANSDGSLHLQVEDSLDHHDLRTPAGTVTTGTRYHLAIQFGRAGIQVWLDGNASSNGWPLLEHWYGWDHRVRGGAAETLVDGERWLNNHPLRIGHNGFDANGEVQVRHWAVFVSGDTDYNPWTRTGTRLARADVEAIAGVAGTNDLDDYRFSGSTINISASDSAAARRAAIEGASAGDTIVLATGTHTITGSDLTIPSGVRMVGGSSNRADTVLTMPAGAEVVSPDAIWLNLTSLDNHGTLNAGDYYIDLTDASGVQQGDIIIIVSTVNWELDWYGTSIMTTGVYPLQKRGDLVSVDSVSGNRVYFKQTLLAPSYTAGERDRIYRFRPGWYGNVLDNFTILCDAAQTATSNATWLSALEVRGGVDVKFRNMDIRQTCTEAEQRCVRFFAPVNVEMSNSYIATDSPSVATDGAYHPYAFTIGAGRSIIAKSTEFVSDWSASLDSNMENLAQETGTNLDYYGMYMAMRWFTEVDCVLNCSHASIGLSGHERHARRAICCTTPRGAVWHRMSYHDETWGISLGNRWGATGGNGGYEGGQKSIHHHIQCGSITSHDGMWYQWENERMKDCIFSYVHGVSRSVANYNGTITNCQFVNCNSPTPP